MLVKVGGGLLSKKVKEIQTEMKKPTNRIERNRSFCCCLKKFLHGAGKDGRNERREREKEECSATCSLNEILFFSSACAWLPSALMMAVSASGGIIRSFGLVCQIRA